MSSGKGGPSQPVLDDHGLPPDNERDEPVFAAEPTRRHAAHGSVNGDESSGDDCEEQQQQQQRASGGDDDGDDGHHRHLQFLLDDEEAHNALVRENEEKERQVKNLKADPWRFAVAPIFSLLTVSNAMQWIAFSPIVNEVREYFSMNATQVNFLATTYVIAYVAIVFLSCKLYEVTGIKNGVLVAAATNAMGSLLKIIALYAWPHAALLYIAQVFNSFTEVLTIATPPLISNRWFPENERMVANTIMSSALNFGCGIGVLIPTFFVGPDKQGKKHFANFFWFHFALCFFMLGMIIFLFPKKPRYAASFAADRQQNKEEERLRALNDVLHHRDAKKGGKRKKNGQDGAGDEEFGEAGSSVTQPGGTRVVDGDNSNTDNAGDLQPPSPVTAAKRLNNATHNAAASALVEASIPLTSPPEEKRNSGSNELEDDVSPFITTTTTAAAAATTSKGMKKMEDEEPAAVGAGEDAAVFDRDSFFNDTETNTTSGDTEVEPVNVFSVLMDCFREARRNYSFVLLMLGAAAELGLIWAVATVLPQMLMPYGVSEAMSGWIGFLNLVLGTVVCPFLMPIVERFGRRYKLILCVIAIILLVNMVLLTLLLHFGPKLTVLDDGTTQEDNSYYVIVTFVLWGGISGLCQNFMMPLMFEYVVELTFPMAESTSAPCLTWAACLTNFILTLVFGEVLGDAPTENHSLRVFIGSTVVTAIGAAALIFTKPMHKRRDYENLKKEEQQRLAQEIVELRFTIDNNNNHMVGNSNMTRHSSQALLRNRHGEAGSEHVGQRQGEFSDAGSHHSRSKRV